MIPELPADVRRLIEEHRAFYESSPHYAILEERPAGAARTMQRIQDGIDVDIYGVNTSRESWPPPDYELGYRTLHDLAVTLFANNAGSCAVAACPRIAGR